MPSHKLQSALTLTVVFSKCIILGKVYQLCHRYLETVRNISFSSTVLELYGEITLYRKPFEIGHMHVYFYIYIYIVTCCLEGRIEIPIARQRIELCIRGYN
jgi:hypothetical protein